MNPLEALSALRGAVPVLNPGHVWLAGAGPGDPGLLTLDALAGLAQADVVVHDALVDQRVLSLANPSAGLEYAGKRGGKPSTVQSDISNRLIELARQNKRVLRLKGGDPCMFGRGGEEVEAVRAAGLPVEVVPGVSSALAERLTGGRYVDVDIDRAAAAPRRIGVERGARDVHRAGRDSAAVTAYPCLVHRARPRHLFVSFTSSRASASAGRR